ncbi:MAG: Uma2 family endonuclease [Cyanobacteria bacterium J06600_6]
MVAATRRKFTVEEYHRLADLGFFHENEKIELIRGEIIAMAPKRTPHSVANSQLWQQFYELLGKQAEIRVQEPITLLDNSEPEPDVVIAQKKADNYLAAHPTVADIILVIEISDSTLKYDCESKLALYAEAGVKHYWIVNLVDRRLETYSNPFSDGGDKFDYRNKSVILPSEIANIPEFDDLSLKLDSVFPQ